MNIITYTLSHTYTFDFQTKQDDMPMAVTGALVLSALYTYAWSATCNFTFYVDGKTKLPSAGVLPASVTISNGAYITIVGELRIMPTCDDPDITYDTSTDKIANQRELITFIAAAVVCK